MAVVKAPTKRGGRLPPAAKKNDNNNDDDLVDLMHGAQGSGVELEPLHVRPQSHRVRPTGQPTPLGCADYIYQWMNVLCHFYPKCCGCLITTVVVVICLGLAQMMSPYQNIGIIVHDHSGITSEQDLRMAEIDHWCIQGGDDSCRCEDPREPISRGEYKSWVQAFKGNRKIVKKYNNASRAYELDVAFLGESVIETMDGRWMGVSSRNQGMMRIAQVFDDHFAKRKKDHYKNAKFNGIALGIAGDTAPNVLWRLLHGEMESWFNPRVWWVSVGMNDLARMKCSEEVVEIGVLRVVEEILKTKPHAHIVINSLFPMSEMRGSIYPVISDYKDAFQNTQGQVLVPPRFPQDTNDSDKQDNGDANRRKLRATKSKDLPPPVFVKRQFDTVEQAEAEADKEAEQEEEERDRKYNKEHKREKRMNDVKLNKDQVLVDRKRIHQFRPSLRPIRFPIWTSIKAINNALQKFADKHDRVSFFDSTALFTHRDGKYQMLDSTLITPTGHLTLRGYQAWEDAISIRLEQILKNLRETDPSVFGPQPSGVNGDKNVDKEYSYGYSDDMDVAADDDFNDDHFTNDMDDDIRAGRNESPQDVPVPQPAVTAAPQSEIDDDGSSSSSSDDRM